jgi:hypothetical protein
VIYGSQSFAGEVCGVVMIIVGLIGMIACAWPHLKRWPPRIKKEEDGGKKHGTGASAKKDGPAHPESILAPAEFGPEPTLLSLMETGLPQFGKKSQDVTVQFSDGSSVQVRSTLYFELHSNATFLGFHVPSSPNALSACFVLAKDAREIAQQLAGTGLRMIATNPNEPSQELTDFGFTGKVYIYHEDRLTHKQMGEVEEAFKAQKLAGILRGPDFLTPAWIAWKEKGQPNITWDTISLQKLVFEDGRFRRFVPYEKAAFMFGIFIVVKNPPIKGQKIISAGDVKIRLLFQTETRGVRNISRLFT